MVAAANGLMSPNAPDPAASAGNSEEPRNGTGTLVAETPPEVRPLSFVRLATQFENAGDCLINRELVRLLAERGEVFLDVGRCPEWFAREVASAAAEGRLRRDGRPFYLEMLLARMRGRRCLWFLMPGAVSGGLKVSGGVPPWVRDLPLRFASSLGVRICQIGASFGGISEDHLAVWRQRRRHLSVLSPRDTISAGYLERNGVRCDPCIPDLAFNLFGGAELPMESPGGRGHAAAYSFRTDQYPQQADEVTGVLAAICRSAGREVRWMPVVQVARDLGGMETLRTRLVSLGIEGTPVMDCHRDIEACFRFYRGVSLVVSNRLHVLLMAASQGARILAVTGGPTGAKIEGVFRDLGMGEVLVDPQSPRDISSAKRVGYTVEGQAKRDQLRQAFDALFLGGRPRRDSPGKGATK
jgi:hypothetical protein